MFKILLICALVACAAASDAVEELRSDDIRADGFATALKVSNSIDRAESGDIHGNIDGHFSWVSPEGVHVVVKYVANENGYQPSSDLLPTPPPIPAEIQRSLEWIAAHGQKA
ncbi:Lcp3 [Drosophila busckii]|uniref:Lcp3 n=1 Tax=Drosophila busckii TaxID=30019 RepID=A0A0M4EII8_DROBS|nr:larval cuticle protein III/IV [Drosophila busckii]ALC40917.1 Lcp3 [Drosophila busckii]